MGLSESTMSHCINGVLGSFDCTCKSKCCDYCEFLKCYYHCHTTQGDSVTDSEDENDECTLSSTPLDN